jgi:hypothetical protein
VQNAAGFCLVELDSNTVLFSPNDVAGDMLPVGGQHQGEVIGNTDRAVDVQRGADVRYLANGAVTGAAAELDRSGLQYTVPRRSPLFIHGVAQDRSAETLSKRNPSECASAYNRYLENSDLMYRDCVSVPELQHFMAAGP